MVPEHTHFQVYCDYCYCTLTSMVAAEKHKMWHERLALLIYCPACHAKPGGECFDVLTNSSTYLHDARVMLR